MWETLGVCALWVGGTCSAYLILAMIFSALRRRTNTFIAADNFSKSGKVTENGSLRRED